MLATDNEVAAIPAAALLKAHAESVNDQETKHRLVLLSTLPGITVVDLDAAAAEDAAESVAAVNGDLALGQAVRIALKHRAYLFSVEPGEAAAVLKEGQIVRIPAEDA
jgi:hypothetical protein